MQHFSDSDISTIINKIASLFKTNVLSNGQYIQSWKYWEKIETLSPSLLARICSTIDYGEKGYKLPEQILFNFLALFPTLLLTLLTLHPAIQMIF